MALPDTLLAKPVGKLQGEDMLAYQRHPVLGAQALMAMEDHQTVAQLIRHHHERFDGGGFPDKLAGADIPLGARIIAVVDTFDELTHGHLTGAALTDAEAKTIIQHGRGKQFDPEVVDLFLHLTQVEKPKAGRLEPVALDGLQQGMVLGKDLLSKEGVLLAVMERGAGRFFEALPRVDRPCERAIMACPPSARRRGGRAPRPRRGRPCGRRS